MNFINSFFQMNIKNSELEAEVKSLKSENFKLRLRTYNRLSHSTSSESSDSFL